MSWVPFDLSGKSAMVTGGAMGIGLGIVTRFVEAGDNVLIADVDGDAAAEKAAALKGHGERCRLRSPCPRQRRAGVWSTSESHVRVGRHPGQQRRDLPDGTDAPTHP
jgi:NAD(P)-dependent dehydrogenase (short-subunit alcohol dehydrogenase family)